MSYFLIINMGYDGTYIREYDSKKAAEKAFLENGEAEAIIKGYEIKTKFRRTGTERKSPTNQKILWGERGSNYK